MARSTKMDSISFMSFSFKFPFGFDKSGHLVFQILQISDHYMWGDDGGWAKVFFPTTQVMTDRFQMLGGEWRNLILDFDGYDYRSPLNAR